jgi:hypothetical protein
VLDGGSEGALRWRLRTIACCSFAALVQNEPSVAMMRTPVATMQPMLVEKRAIPCRSVSRAATQPIAPTSIAATPRAAAAFTRLSIPALRKSTCRFVRKIA